MYLSNQGPTALLWLWSSCLWPKDERRVGHWRAHRLSNNGIDRSRWARLTYVQTRHERSNLDRPRARKHEERRNLSTSHRTYPGYDIQLFWHGSPVLYCFSLSVVPFRRSGTMVIKKKKVRSCHPTTVGPMDMHGLGRTSWITADSCWLLVIITHMPKRNDAQLDVFIFWILTGLVIIANCLVYVVNRCPLVMDNALVSLGNLKTWRRIKHKTLDVDEICAIRWAFCGIIDTTKVKMKECRYVVDATYSYYEYMVGIHPSF